MSKKDYQAVAAALYRVRTLADVKVEHLTHKEHAQVLLGYVQSAIADVFAADNSRFDRARFVEACETGRCKGMRQVGTAPAPVNECHRCGIVGVSDAHYC